MSEGDFSRGHNGRYGRALTDFAGRQAMSTIFGEAITAGKVDDISVQFQYNNSTVDLVIETPAGTGGQSNANSMMRVTSGAGVGKQTVYSKDSIRYRPGHEAFAQYTSRFVGAGEGINQMHGIGNGADRVCFGTKDGIFGTWYQEGGNTPIFTSQASFKGDPLDGSGPSGFNIDPTKENILYPVYGWLGIAPIIWIVYGGLEIGWILADWRDEINESEEPHLDNPSLPIVCETERLSGSGEAFIETSSWRGGVISQGQDDLNASTRVFNYAVTEVAVGGSSIPTAVLIVRNKTTFQGKNNHVKVKPIILSFITEGTKPTLIQGVKGATYATVPVFGDTDTANSVMEFAVGPHVISTPIPIPTSAPATYMDKVDAREVDAERRRVIIYPGEELAIVATSANATLVTMTVTMYELF